MRIKKAFNLFRAKQTFEGNYWLKVGDVVYDDKNKKFYLMLESLGSNIKVKDGQKVFLISRSLCYGIKYINKELPEDESSTLDEIIKENYKISGIDIFYMIPKEFENIENFREYLKDAKNQEIKRYLENKSFEESFEVRLKNYHDHLNNLDFIKNHDVY